MQFGKVIILALWVTLACSGQTVNGVTVSFSGIPNSATTATATNTASTIVARDGSGNTTLNNLLLSTAVQPLIRFNDTSGTTNHLFGRIVYDGGENLAGGGWIWQKLTDAGGFSANLVSIRQNDGFVSIGNLNFGQALDVTGTIRQSGCTTAGTLSANASGDIICTSDERLKNDLGPYSGGLMELARIQPRLFTWKPTPTNPVETFVHAGFFAQNVRAAIPQASAEQKDGYYSLDTTAVLAAAVNSINELAAEVARLRARIKDNN